MRSLAILLFVLSINLSAQETKSILNVRGQAEIAVKPTLTTISMNIQSMNSSYTKSIEEIINRVDQLTNELKRIRFKDEEIVTSNFIVNKNFSYDRGQRKEDGFIATQTLKVSFEQDKKRLLKVLSTATSSSAEPEIFISFDLDASEKEQLRNELIKAAVKDAKTKAELIASESGYQIGGIREINYGVSPRAFSEPQAYRADFLEESVAVSNFEAADLRFTDVVNISFILVKN